MIPDKFQANTLLSSPKEPLINGLLAWCPVGIKDYIPTKMFTAGSAYGLIVWLPRHLKHGNGKLMQQKLDLLSGEFGISAN